MNKTYKKWSNVRNDIDEIKEEVGMLTHEYVDLGLPSGTLWATMNVGATSETDYGNYYMYGMGAKTYDSSDTPYQGTEDPLPEEYDTAAQVWGKGWRMPTEAQIQELQSDTTYQWIINYQGSGINGVLVTGPNGNTIFLPAAGYYINGTSIDVGATGSYWTASPAASSDGYVYGFDGFGWISETNNNRKVGMSVRPVHAPFPVSPAKVKDALGINSSTGSTTKYLNEKGNFVFETAYETSIAVDDLIGSSISTNTKNALIALRGDRNSYGRLILLRSHTYELTYIPSYISSYGSEFNMWFNYEDKFYHIQASPDNSQWAVITLSKQDEITATGLLKGNGSGTISAAVAGTDYQAPLTFNTTPSSTNKVATMADLTKSNVGLGNVDNTSDSQKSVNYANSAGSAPAHSYIVTQGDNRNDSTYPTDYSSKLVFRGLKMNTAIDLPSSDPYQYLVGLKGWHDSSGGNAWEIAFNNSGINVRQGADNSSWGSWYKLATTSDLSNYLPLSGGEISGGQTTFGALNTNTSVYFKGNDSLSTVGFKSANGNTTFGYLGVNSSNNPIFYDLSSHVIIHEGNISSYLPTTMVASGSNHAGGLVPDTPSTAGTTKYLREDGTWSVPQADLSYENPTTATSYTINSNMEYFLNPVNGNLSITLGSPTANIKNEYNFQFDIPISNTSCTVTMPSTVIWASEPTFEAGNHYEVSIKYDPIRTKYYGLCTAFFRVTLADRLTSSDSIDSDTPYVIAGTYSDGVNGTITNPIIVQKNACLMMCGSNSRYAIAYYDVKTGTIKTNTYTSSNYSTVYSTILNPIRDGINTKFSKSYGTDETFSVPSFVEYYIEL